MGPDDASVSRQPEPAGSRTVAPLPPCLSSSSEEAQKLRERVKELDCLCSISRIAYRRGASRAHILSQIVKLVPAAWMYPEVAEARIVVEGEDYRTPGFRETAWRQAATIIVDGAAQGTLTVCYQEERPEGDEGPFLREERNLINVIAQRVGEIVERKRAEIQLAEYRDQLRSLAQQITRTEDRERRRIACDLHDRVGQALSIARVRLGVLLCRGLPDDVARDIEWVRDLVARSIEDTRTLVFDISPPVLYELGLPAALEWLVERLRDRQGMDIEMLPPPSWEPVGEELRTALFVAAREFLYNVLRHAGPCRVHLMIEQRGGAVEVRVEDDGRGFDPDCVKEPTAADGGFGLFAVRERIRPFGGHVEIASAPGQGTRVLLRVPYTTGVAGSREVG